MRITTLDQLIERMDSTFDRAWDGETRQFVPLDVEEAPLTVREALTQADPEHYGDRSFETRDDQPRPPVVWPDWVW